MVIEELSSGIKGTDKWSRVISRDMPVDSNHALFPLGSDIAFNVAYRGILKDYGTGGGKLLFYPGADVTEAQNMAAKDLIHYGQVAT